MTDLEEQLWAIINPLPPEKKLMVYEYAASLKDGPKGNTCRCCSQPLAKCECDK